MTTRGRHLGGEVSTTVDTVQAVNHGSQAAPPSARLVAIDELCELTGLPRRTAWALVERLGLETQKALYRGRMHTCVDALALSVALIRERRERRR